MCDSDHREKFVKEDLLGVNVSNANIDTILKYVVDTISKTSRNFYCVTPNPEIIVYASKHKEYQAILNKADVSLCDGIGILWASLLLHKVQLSRITGVDFVVKLCQEVSNQPISVGFLGGKELVAELASKRLKAQFPLLDITFVSEEWNEKSIHKLSGHTLDILFVAYGFPKQEIWISEHINKLPIRFMVGVGGAFDYISGTVRRAPFFLRLLGLEWLFRLFTQPWRWRRQISLIDFVILVVRKKYQSMFS